MLFKKHNKTNNTKFYKTKKIDFDNKPEMYKKQVTPSLRVEMFLTSLTLLIPILQCAQRQIEEYLWLILLEMNQSLMNAHLIDNFQRHLFLLKSPSLFLDCSLWFLLLRILNCLLCLLWNHFDRFDCILSCLWSCLHPNPNLGGCFDNWDRAWIVDFRSVWFDFFKSNVERIVT